MPKRARALARPARRAYAHARAWKARVWLFLHEKHLSHRQLDTYDAIVGALCRVWNALTEERLHSLTSYPYLEQIRI